jgi:hypothetical protein
MPLDAVIQFYALRVRSAFSEAERFSSCCRKSLIVYNPSAVSPLWQGCFRLALERPFLGNRGQFRGVHPWRETKKLGTVGLRARL